MRFLDLCLKSAIIAQIVILWLYAVSCNVQRQILGATEFRALDIFYVEDDKEITVMQELDMMLTFKQLRFIYTNSSRRKRSISRPLLSRWPNAVVRYEITENIQHFSEDIVSAIGEFTKFSCLKFVETNHSIPRVQFTEGKGCWSHVGVNKYKTTKITLAPPCQQASTVIHEIGHTIGLFHEQNRPDRDKYVTIEEKLLPNTDWLKLSKCTGLSAGIEYDYRSIMHYSNGVTAKDHNFRGIIGIVFNLSFRDIKLMNIAYQCAHRAKCKKKTCPFNGFVLSKALNEENACECWCDSGDLYNDEPLVLCSTIDESLEPVYDFTGEGSVADKSEQACLDLLNTCADLKENGMCFTKFQKMNRLCPVKCNFCGKNRNFCADRENTCVIIAESGVCKDHKLEKFMNNVCPKSCGQCTRNVSNCDIQGFMETKSYPHADCAFTSRQWASVFIAFFLILF